MNKLLPILGIIGCFNVTPSQTHNVDQLERFLDNDLRLQYYSSCKKAKQKDCHMNSFNRAVKLRIANVI